MKAHNWQEPWSAFLADALIFPGNKITNADGLMAAVGLDVEEAEKAISGTAGIVVACDNSPTSVTISGSTPDVAFCPKMAQICRS